MDDSDLNELINQDEVRKSISYLHSNKSPGPDGLCIELFKCTLDYILPFLTTVFNTIFSEGIVPESWGGSIIWPIHKKGSLSNPDNFRGVLLINTICKIFCNITVKRLDDWTAENNIIHKSQAGFRRNYSTIDNIFTFQSLIQKHISKKGGRFYCIFIDYKKAFDSVNHDKLWEALERKDIGGSS